METNQTIQVEDEIEIDFSGVLKHLWRKMPITILVAVAVAALGFVYSTFYLIPMYKSSTTMYVLYQEENQSTTAYQGMVVGEYIINDYEQIIKSRYVLTKVIENLGLNMSVASLGYEISVSNPKDTRFVTLTVTDANPINAMQIADEVRDVASEHIKTVLNAAAVNTVDQAYLPTYPSSPNVSKYTCIGAIAGFMFMCILFALKYVLSDALRTPEDIENRLGVSCLSVIPVNTGKLKKK